GMFVSSSMSGIAHPLLGITGGWPVPYQLDCARLLFSVPLGSSEDWPSYQVGTAPGNRRLMGPGYVRGVANRASEPGGSEFPAYTPSGIPTAPRLSGGFSILREIPAGALAYHHDYTSSSSSSGSPGPTSARGRRCPAGLARSASRWPPRLPVGRGCGATQQNRPAGRAHRDRIRETPAPAQTDSWPPRGGSTPAAPPRQPRGSCPGPGQAPTPRESRWPQGRTG